MPHFRCRYCDKVTRGAGPHARHEQACQTRPHRRPRVIALVARLRPDPIRRAAIRLQQVTQREVLREFRRRFGG